MPTAVGPNTKGEENLVFGYDLGDVQNSYKGEPTTNEFLTTTIGNYSGYGGNGTLVPDALDPFGTTDNPVYRKTGKLRFGPTGGEDVGTLYYGNTYTFSIYLRYASGEAPWTGGEFDLYDRSDSRDFTGGLGDNMTYEWKRFAVTAYHNNSSNYHFVDIGHYQGTNVFEWCCPQIDAGDHATPFTQTTRSATQGLLDLKGDSTIDLTNVSFDSNAQLTFDGSDDRVLIPTFNLGTDPIFAISMVIKRTTSFNNGGYWGLGGGGSNNGICGYTSSSNKIGWDLWGRTTFHINEDYPLNEWVHVCWVKTSTGFTTSSLKVYVNGEEKSLSVTVRNNSSSVNLVDGLAIGRISDNFNGYYAPGEVALTKVYNRALTASEVKANYNAVKGRFNI